VTLTQEPAMNFSPTEVHPSIRYERRLAAVVGEAIPCSPIPAGKDVFDRCLGLVGLVVASPVIFLAWMLVRLTSRGAGFYSQTRSGIGGKPFRIYKIRTMYQNCEAKSGAKWCVKGDARVTPVGRILRKLHVDELPQLWNIVRGDMSLVGPRPERPEFVETLKLAIPGYTDRLRVKPGLTGLAQIQLPPDSTVQSVARKLEKDLLYIREMSFTLDARIYFGTVIYLVGFSYNWVRRLAYLPSETPATKSPGNPERTLAVATPER
jgi:lipopolysaccharide/colanic/teichoic acid biosynthesis glycosyltransferase